MIEKEVKVTKSFVENYKVRFSGGIGWADITIDANDDGGRIQIASDYGNWQYYWGSTGRAFKDFLRGLNKGYVAGKLGADKFFDAPKTVEYMYRIAKEAMDANNLARPLYKDIFQEIKYLESRVGPYKDEFLAELQQTKYLLSFLMNNDGTELCFKNDPGFDQFWEKVWPELLREFEKEKTDPLNIKESKKVNS